MTTLSLTRIQQSLTGTPSALIQIQNTGGPIAYVTEQNTNLPGAADAIGSGGVRYVAFPANGNLYLFSSDPTSISYGGYSVSNPAPATGSVAPSAAVDTGLFGDNFMRANSATIGNGAVDRQGGVFSISGNKLKLASSAPATGQDTTNGYLRDWLLQSFTPTADHTQEGTVLLPTGSSDNASVGFLVGVQSNGDHYLVSLGYNSTGPATTSFYKNVGGAVSGLGGGTQATFESANLGLNQLFRWRVDRRVAGGTSSIRLRLWDDASGAPLEDRTATDMTAGLQGAGVVGLTAWNIASGKSPEWTQWLGGALPTPTKLLLCYGDSMTNGQYASAGVGTATGTTWPAVCAAALGDEWVVVNMGVDGRCLGPQAGAGTGMNANVATEIAAKIALYPGLTPHLVLMGGTNDLGIGGKTGPEAWALAKSVLAKAKAAGCAKTLIQTLLPANHPAYAPSGSFNPKRTAFNTLARGEWRTVCDGLVDIGGHWLLGQTGAENRRAYYNAPDLTHLLDPGLAIQGACVAEAVRRLG